MKNKIIVAATALIAVFLVGFVPQYVKVNRLENELSQSRQETAGAELRDLISFAYVQASQKELRPSRRNQQPFLQSGPRSGEPDAGREPPKRPGGSACVTGQRHGSVGEGRRGGDGRSPATLRQGAGGDAEFELSPQSGRCGPGDMRPSRWMPTLPKEHVGCCPAPVRSRISSVIFGRPPAAGIASASRDGSRRGASR